MKIFPVGLVNLVLGSLLGSSALASDAITACTAIADPAPRLECYDRATGRKTEANPPAAVAAGAANIPAEAAVVHTAVHPPVDAAATFGLSRDKIAVVEQEAEEMSGTVADVADHTQPGRWVVTLTNGQVWEQRELTAPAKRPRPGEAVTVRKASLGSYMMSVAGRGSSRVRRIW